MSGSNGVDRHLPLHPEAFRILMVLLDGEAHGYAIVKELERDPGRPGRVLPANLYRRIRTLQEQGLIEEADNRPDPELDDERRRYFAVTQAGMAVARAEARRLEALVVGARARDLLTP
jgi:DNA-binding PadR family transcriptional regulator